jgi:hypothetical protein
MKTEIKPKPKPTWSVPIKGTGSPIDWLEAIDVKREKINFELDILSRKVERSGEELAQYCESQGYSKVAALVRSLLFRPPPEL